MPIATHECLSAAEGSNAEVWQVITA